ncbi:Actin cytoskeleton-regulatory complex protein pan1 [Sphaceloma murrayae]|uniref:Actin cytoskeleton-regulatory complex protein pan1 n=1 Tax=Sphaceloma murrayae TaxID=2082308 RepID=A0A2K1QGQ3_9PEZI|nr:Actin cytoskeleton-regulatory complex protein pan1 [Sphaceloma murrayae]
MRAALVLSALGVVGARASAIDRRQITDLCDRRFYVCQSAGQSTAYCECERTTCRTGNTACQNPTTSTPSAPIITAAPHSLPLGAPCADNVQCWGGAECFASNVLRQRQCGGFNAACTLDAQCAGTTCNNGLCNGPPQSGSKPPVPPINVPIGTLKLDELCSDDKQCNDGAQCFASNAMLIRRCGNFNAACTKDSQCTFNTCSNGLCRGVLPTGSVPAPGGSTGTAPVPPKGTGSGTPPQSTGSGTPPRGNGTAPITPSKPTPPPFTGEAEKLTSALSALGAVALIICVL